jgi:hypothetical protein
MKKPHRTFQQRLRAIDCNIAATRRMLKSSRRNQVKLRKRVAQITVGSKKLLKKALAADRRSLKKRKAKAQLARS